MFVKICGITNFEDACAAIEFGASAIGFVFASSPRSSGPDHLQGWIDRVSPETTKVGVFVNENPGRIEAIAAQLHLDVAQLHGGEAPEQHPANLRIWRAYRVDATTPPLPDYPAEALLLDGATFDWANTTHLSKPLILAGGLTPDNVQARIRAARQHHELLAVDVASGVESRPGRKDHNRMKQFIQAALSA